MITTHSFVFGPFQENTYLLFDETRECVIIDPGCYDDKERELLTSFIAHNKLNPVQLLNTHCHIDHVVGNKFIAEKYKLGLSIHKNDLQTLKALMQVAHIYGLNVEESPDPSSFLEEGDVVKFGDSTLDIFFTPGHSSGSISFLNAPQKWVIAGDVLFRESIGRTDLPGGDYHTLIASIKTKLLILEDDFIVYSGHGPSTTIGHERRFNSFLR